MVVKAVSAVVREKRGPIGWPSDPLRQSPTPIGSAPLQPGLLALNLFLAEGKPAVGIPGVERQSDPPAEQCEEGPWNHAPLTAKTTPQIAHRRALTMA